MSPHDVYFERRFFTNYVLPKLDREPKTNLSFLKEWHIFLNEQEEEAKKALANGYNKGGEPFNKSNFLRCMTRITQERELFPWPDDADWDATELPRELPWYKKLEEGEEQTDHCLLFYILIFGAPFVILPFTCT